MTLRETEEMNHLEQAEVVREEMKEMSMMTTMAKSSRSIKVDMEAEMTTNTEIEKGETEGIEMIQDAEDMMTRKNMVNIVTETMTGDMRMTEKETYMKTDIEAVEEALPTGIAAARGNEEVARRLRAIGSVPQASPWLQSRGFLWRRQAGETKTPVRRDSTKDL